jgi:hypothetical protein
MKRHPVPVFILFALLLSSAFAQQTWEDQLDEKLVQHFKKTMPDWTHERVEPIVGSKNVLIQFWSFSNRKAKVSILLHDSVEKAREVIQNHVRYSFTSETLTGIGDEAYSSPGHASSMVAFRRGKFTVYIFTPADVDPGPDAQTRLEREKEEVERLSRELAKQVVAGIDTQ